MCRAPLCNLVAMLLQKFCGRFNFSLLVGDLLSRIKRVMRLFLWIFSIALVVGILERSFRTIGFGFLKAILFSMPQFVAKIAFFDKAIGICLIFGRIGEEPIEVVAVGIVVVVVVATSR